VARPFYQVVSEEPFADLKRAPSFTYIITSLEISVSHEGGKGLLLRLHSYPPAADREGYWATPGLQVQPLQPRGAPVNNAEVLAFIAGIVKHDSPTWDLQMKGFAESFGLRDVELERVLEEPLIELKPSIQSPRIHNLFATVRYRILDDNKDSRRNLLDPEGRHGFVTLPLDRIDDATFLAPDPDGTGRDSRHFLGKPLISGLDHLLSTPRAVEALRRDARDVTKASADRRHYGFIACADIAGYGAALSAELTTILASPEKDKSDYRRQILAALETTLESAGTTQVQSAGDGFVAGYPCVDEPAALQVVLSRILASWTATLRNIAFELNPVLQRNAMLEPLGSRMAIASGSYTWGRANGLSSFFPAFDGDAIVTAARMEQGVRSAMYKSGLVMKEAPTSTSTSKMKMKMTRSGHYLALSHELEDAARSIESTLTRSGWAIRGKADIKAKTMKIADALILEWTPTQQDERED
jgi:class 3 adenylate cyclase